MVLNTPHLPHGLGFLCSHRGANLIFHAHCLLSKKLVAALIVTGEGRAETIAICLAFFPSLQLSHFVEPHLLRRHLSERNVLQGLEKFLTLAALLSNIFDRASSTTNCKHPGLQCDSPDQMRIDIKTPSGWTVQESLQTDPSLPDKTTV